MKYKCIKDIGGLGCLEVGKVYDVTVEEKYQHTIYVVNRGKTNALLSEETVSTYLEKVED